MYCRQQIAMSGKHDSKWTRTRAFTKKTKTKFKIYMATRSLIPVDDRLQGNTTHQRLTAFRVASIVNGSGWMKQRTQCFIWMIFFPLVLPKLVFKRRLSEYWLAERKRTKFNEVWSVNTTTKASTAPLSVFMCMCGWRLWKIYKHQFYSILQSNKAYF